MSTALAALLFLVSLVATLAAAALFADRLDHFGEQLGLPEALVGLLTAFAADAPEITSAIFALARGAHDVGLGVVVGSNLFNIAAMLGVTALITPVLVRRTTVALEGTVAVGVTAVVTLFAFGVLPAAASLALVAVLVVPYVAVIALLEEGVLPGRRVLGPRHRRERRGPVAPRTYLLIAVAVTVIVLGSFGMVHAAITLGHRWGIPEIVIGTVLLAVLTSIPNAYTGIRLGIARRGSALVSDTMNSNTINLVGGIAIPALFVTFSGAFSTLQKADMVWLLAVTALTVGLLAGGLRRAAGGLLIAAWLAFVVAQVVWG